ncbi:MAG: hypothetical protein AAGG47_20125 [Pseudomonadota bacterium]
MNGFEKILRSRGQEPSSTKTPESGGRSVTLSGGQPQVGFILINASSTVAEMFYFHSIRNAKLQTKKGTEYLSFAHEGTVVTMTGRRLIQVLQAMRGCTLVELRELGQAAATVSDDEPVITALRISNIGVADAIATRAEEMLLDLAPFAAPAGK